MEQNRVVEIEYRAYTSAAAKRRKVEPYCVKLFENRWYLIGRSAERDRIRIYGLDRMMNVKVLDERFELPADFDAEEFLRGAKMAYNRLQAAWDSRDLNDIAQFASPAVMDAVRQQLAEETEPSKTEILLVNAQLLSVVNEDKEQRAQVYFDVLMRERPDQPTPSNVREIWHFVRELDGGTWKLDGIQQVA